MRWTMIILALLVLACVHCNARAEKPHMVTIGMIQWHTDYDEAMAVARRDNKPLWLHFGENPG